MVRARIEPGIKKNAEIIFNKLGISPSQAINMFYASIILNNGIPFEIKIPNKTTRKTFEKTDNHTGLKSFTSAKELIKDLNR